jgi:hypothetical protein
MDPANGYSKMAAQIGKPIVKAPKATANPAIMPDTKMPITIFAFLCRRLGFAKGAVVGALVQQRVGLPMFEPCVSVFALVKITRQCGKSQAKNVHPLGLLFFPPIVALRESGFLPIPWVRPAKLAFVNRIFIRVCKGAEHG